jgi:hypothetical protein
MTRMDEVIGEAAVPARRSGRGLWIGALIVIAFALGLVVAGWALANSSMLRTKVLGPPAIVVAAPPPVTLAQAPAAPAVREVARRLDTLEERVQEVDQKSEAVVGNVDRAEGLLLAFAARRAIDRGLELGYLEGLLREHFGGQDPQAVATIIAASRAPVTLEQLRVGLNDLPSAELITDAGAGWWEGFRRELADIIVIRRADVPSAAPTDRLARARGLLDDGQVDRALAEIARLPGRDKAAGWMADARRYVTARGALDRIEMDSLLAPHQRPS